jgi:hypothetical protein
MAVMVLHPGDTLREWDDEATTVDYKSRSYDCPYMWRRTVSVALTIGILAGTLILAGCATTETRISQHPEVYQHLSARDQALVSQGQIRSGMSMDAVWLAWGTPDQKIPDNMGQRPIETWLYLRYQTPPSYGAPYYYGPFDWSYIPPKFPYASKGATFSNGRVVFFQYVPPPPPL